MNLTYSFNNSNDFKSVNEITYSYTRRSHGTNQFTVCTNMGCFDVSNINRYDSESDKIIRSTIDLIDTELENGTPKSEIMKEVADIIYNNFD